jgi:hypothetical protein
LPEREVRDDLSVEQIEDDYWGDSPADSTYLIRTIHEVRRKPIGLLSAEDLRIMLGQEVGVDILVPRALARLEENPLLEGDFYPGDVLVSVVRLPEAYWRTHPDELSRIKRVIDNLRKLDDPDAQDDDLNQDIEEFLRRVNG